MTTGAERQAGVRDVASRSAVWRRVVPLRSSILLPAAFALLLLVTGAGLYHLTRSTTFSFDEWTWIMTRRGDDLGTFLQTYNGHFSLVPIAIYRLLFATAGLGDYRAYRALVIVAHLACGLLVFVYARRRAGDYLGLLAAALVVLFGSAWADILWPFQIGWLISLAAGVAALLLLDRGDRAGDIAACVLLAVSLSSSGIGIVVAVGLVVDVAIGRRRWRDAWIVVVPLTLYCLWWSRYQHTTPLRRLGLMPHFIVNVAAATLGGLAGRPGQTLVGGGSGTLLAWGRPLAALALVLLVLRLVHLGRVPPRVLALLAMLASFWFLTALTRTAFGLSQSWSSRYLYVGGLVVVLLAVELARGLRVPTIAKLVLTAAVVAALVSNLGNFRNAASQLRLAGQETRADLGALQIGRALVGPDYVASYVPGYPLVHIQAAPYFAAVRAFGTPGAAPAEIAAAPEVARQLADRELVRIHRIGLAALAGAPSNGYKPTVELAAGGTAIGHGACVTFSTANAGAPPAGSRLVLTLESGALRLMAGGGAAGVGVRRFAEGYVSLGTLAASRPATLTISPDLASAAWHLLIVPTARVTACGLR